MLTNVWRYFETALTLKQRARGRRSRLHRPRVTLIPQMMLDLPASYYLRYKLRDKCYL